MSESVLSVVQLHKTYRLGVTSRLIPTRQQVLKGLSFKLKAGTITGFLGGNGAGKTTTLKCLLGMAFPDSGDFFFFGKERLSPSVKRRIGFLPESPYFYDYLTGAEFLMFYGQISTPHTKKKLKERIDHLLKKVDLLFAKDKPLRGYSKGMLQKIGVAQALIHEPELVILDEPMSGLDPDGRFYLAEIIRETAREGKSIFFSSHLLNDAEKLCSDLVILRDGVCVYSGTTEKLLESLDAKVDLSYVHGGQRVDLKLDTLEVAQMKIDEVRKMGGEIQLLQRSRGSLEEAFIRIGLRERNREAP